jgi:hypothetical protein
MVSTRTARLASRDHAIAKHGTGVFSPWSRREGRGRGTAPLTTSTKARRTEENFDVSALPEDAVQQIQEQVTARVQFNVLEQSGGLPGFIPEGM